ncbi:hypothetical protein [Streptomyces sp. GC420]|uniref:hypothetical protein n=1 Tax=Streptomyces sp. GC420 TaxID=2697568 RepID=UPI001FB6AE96|nr:hypothetical protein [Streptomyces sp. GC420]
MSTSPGAPRTEQQLHEALHALAGQVHPAPNAYRAARGDWLRRERRRRLILAVLVTVVFTLAVLIGLWVLNQTPPGDGVIFHEPGTRPGVSEAPLPAPMPVGVRQVP